MLETGKQKKTGWESLLMFILILTTLAKLSLAGKGFLFFPDEMRYSAAGRLLQSLSQRNLELSIDYLFTTGGRPGEVLIYTLPNLFQYLTGHLFHLHFYESLNSYPVFVFNWLIFCLILLTHYRVSRLLLQDRLPALISVILYGTLVNSFLYLRHSLSYDISLLLLYYSFYILLTGTDSGRLTFSKLFWTGVLSSFGYLVYPGYFPLIIAGFLLLVFAGQLSFSKRIFRAFYFGTGCLAPLLFFETLSRLGSRGSFIQDSLQLSGTIVHGSFEESFSFMVKYLITVEGITGFIVLTGLFLFLVFMFRKQTEGPGKDFSTLRLVFLIMSCLFLLYGSLGYFFHKMVFYGRLIHQYLPLITVFVVYGINRLLPKGKTTIPILVSLVVVFAIDFFTKLAQYLPITYPREVCWKLIKQGDIKQTEEVCEHSESWSVMPREKEFFYPNKENHNGKKVVLVNACYFYPLTDLSKFNTYQPTRGMQLVIKEPYPLHFKGYQFEGYNIEERQNLDQLNLQLKVFESTLPDTKP